MTDLELATQAALEAGKLLRAHVFIGHAIFQQVIHRACNLVRGGDLGKERPCLCALAPVIRAKRARTSRHRGRGLSKGLTRTVPAGDLGLAHRAGLSTFSLQLRGHFFQESLIQAQAS